MTGILATESEGRYRLVRAQVNGRRVGAVTLKGKLGGHVGEGARVYGRMRCFGPFRNPSLKEDGWQSFALPRWSGEAVWMGPGVWRDRVLAPTFRGREAFVHFCSLRLSRFPILLALARATWFGDMSLLPASITEAFRQMGLLHVLALSGQHVVILVLVLSMVWRAFIVVVPALAKVARRGPLLVVPVLLMTSLFTPSVVRVAGMVFLLGILKWRKLHVGALRLILVSTAMLMVTCPELIAARGYWLSVFGVTNLILFQDSVLFGVLLLMAMPILMAPAATHFFGVVSLIAPISNPILGGVWEWLVLPMGYALPFLPSPALHVLNDFLAGSAERAVEMTQTIKAVGLTEVGRPTIIELAALTLCVGSLWQMGVKWRGRH